LQHFQACLAPIIFKVWLSRLHRIHWLQRAKRD